MELQRARFLRLVLSKSLPDLTDERCRFIPRDALIEAASQEVVLDILQSCPNLDGEQQALASRISPDNDCHCGQPLCTGGRIVFAALLAVSKDNLIKTFFGITGQAFFDHDLSRLSHGMAYLPRELQDLAPEEQERFIHLTWRMRSPFLQSLALHDSNIEIKTNGFEFDENTSIPWISLGDGVAENEDEEVTRVQRITIHPAHHNLVNFTFFNC
jgi:hypothetical protein